MRRDFYSLRATALTALVSTLACSAPSLEDTLAPEPACRSLERRKLPARPNVILVISDATRRDRVGLYGGPARTPTFDRFARAHLWFDHAFSEAPWTKPAMATLFTSLYPSQHGLTSHPALRARMGDASGATTLQSDVLGPAFVTLAEVLRDHGYRTAAFVSNPWMQHEFGFAQGFDHYVDSFARWSAPGSDVTQAALAWLASRTDEPFFLYLHYIDAHRPYGKLSDEDVLAVLDDLASDAALRPLSMEGRRAYNALIHDAKHGFSPAVVERLRATGPLLGLIELAYDRGVEAFDAELERLLTALATQGLEERTALIVTSDHGEALYARGWGNHGIDLFDDEVAIPLALRLPGVTARKPRIECAAGLVDLFPTLCDYLGIDCPASLAGRSWLDGDGRGAYTVAEGTMFRPENRTLRNRRYKLFYRPEGDYSGARRGWALYDLERDPAEATDLLAATQPPEEVREIFRALSAKLELAIPRFEPPPPAAAPVDAETERRLKALGYLD